MWRLSSKSLELTKKEFGIQNNDGRNVLIEARDDRSRCSCELHDYCGGYFSDLLYVPLLSRLGYEILQHTPAIVDVSTTALFESTLTGVAVVYPVLSCLKVSFCTTQYERDYIPNQSTENNKYDRISWNLLIASKKLACAPEHTVLGTLCKTIQAGTAGATYTLVGAAINGQAISSPLVMKMVIISSAGNIVLPLTCGLLQIGVVVLKDGCNSAALYDPEYSVLDLPCYKNFTTRGAPVSEGMQRDPLLVSDDVNARLVHRT